MARLPSLRRTSYDAKGHLPPPPKFEQELGSAAGTRIIEQVPELTSRFQAIQTYDKMARTDAITAVSLRAGKVPVLGADYYIDPVGTDQQALDVAQFVSDNLFNGMTSPWLYVLSKIVRNFQHGFSIVEPVYESRPWSPSRTMANTRNYTMLRKLAPRPATTIKEIVVDDAGGPVEVVQAAIRPGGKAQEVHIPIAKCMIFPFGDSDDLYGESVLRSSHANWYYKTHLYKIDAIQKERHGVGVPRGTLPPGYSDEDKKFLNELLANIRANERSYITQPPGYLIDFAKPEGQMVDVLKSASYHDVCIMLNIMTEFMMLGFSATGGGSRATGAAQLDIFYKASLFIANMICDAFNLYLIPNLVLWNFQTDVIPHMKVRNVGQSKDQQQLAAALANLFDKEVITPDPETENWARMTFDMPLKRALEDAAASSGGTANVVDAATTTDGQAPSGTTNGRTGITGIGKKGNASTVGSKVKSGTMGKGVTEP